MTPTLLKTGAGALGWRLVSKSELRTTPAALQLREAHRLHALQAAVHEREIQEVVGLLRSRGVEPVLVKGWAIARLYIEPGSRPYGDIDLCVHPDQYRAAKILFDTEVGRKYRVDLHKGFARFGNQPWKELYARSRCPETDGVTVRTLGPEDHLRLLCFHFLREGAWRPLWLCDVSVALEARAPDFDWDLCLGTNQRSREWVACALALAQHLLKANLDGVPPKACAKQPPSWLLPSVLKEWEIRSVYERHKSPANRAWRRPIHSLKRLRCHWPSRVEATIDMNTVDTREPSRDEHLKSADFFHVELHPTLSFKSTRITQVGDGELKVAGDLSIRGVTRNVVFTVEGPTPQAKDPWGNTRIGLSATTKINRKDFGLIWNAALETGGILVGDEVTITLDVQFVKA